MIFLLVFFICSDDHARAFSFSFSSLFSLDGMKRHEVCTNGDAVVRISYKFPFLFIP